MTYSQSVPALISKNVGNTLTNYKTWGGIMYNVLDNGLKGGGTIDDTAALQTLINTAVAAGRKAIYFPHGTNGQYRVTALTNANQVVFFGDNASFVGGYTGTIIQMGQGGVTPAEFAALQADVTALEVDLTQRAVNVKSAPYNATGGGTGNDTAAIQLALDSGKDVFIPGGTFMIDALLGLNIPSNTTIYMTPDTILKVIPNAAEVYNVLRINNVSNIRVIGNGASIIGDRATHTGTTGEWGYGVQFNNSQNVYVDGLTIKDMWGDGINLDSIGGLQSNVNRNILIRNVVCDNNRRQGMSISGVEDMLVENCKFTGTNGTAPQAGIDFEPSFPAIWNRRVVLRNCVLENNVVTQMTIWSRTEEVKFYDCQFIGTTAATLWLVGLTGGNNLFENCKIYGVSQKVQNAKFIYCEFSVDNTNTSDGTAIITMADVYLEFLKCTIRATGNKNLMYLDASASESTRKIFSDCTFIQDGNGFADTNNVLVASGFYTFKNTKFIHTGSNPATGYLIGVGGAAGTNQKLINCYIDPILSYFYGLQGWGTINNEKFNQQEAFITPTLLNGWVNFGGGYASASYYKDQFGIVHIKGLLKSGTTTAPTAIFTLPAGYRPASIAAFSTTSYNGTTYLASTVEVAADGSFRIGSNVANNFLSIEGISFRAEQ